jgi:hypothetical protein
VSLQVVSQLSRYIHSHYLYVILSIGPLLGLIAMLRLVSRRDLKKSF